MRSLQLDLRSHTSNLFALPTNLVEPQYAWGSLILAQQFQHDAVISDARETIFTRECKKCVDETGNVFAMRKERLNNKHRSDKQT